MKCLFFESKWIKKIFIFFLFVFIFISSYGQRLDIIGSLGGSYLGGNFDSYQLNTQVNLGQDFKKISWNVNPLFIYSKILVDDQWKQSQRESYLTFSSSYKDRSNRYILFIEAENSHVKKIDFRGTLGFGYGNEIINKGGFRIQLSEAVVPEIYFSRVYINKNLSSLRLSTRLKIEYLGKIKITSISLFQPAIWSDHPLFFKDNINSRFINSIDFPIAKMFLIGLEANAYLSTFSSYVDFEVKPIDYNFSLVLKYKNY